MNQSDSHLHHDQQQIQNIMINNNKSRVICECVQELVNFVHFLSIADSSTGLNPFLHRIRVETTDDEVILSAFDVAGSKTPLSGPKVLPTDKPSPGEGRSVLLISEKVSLCLII